MKYIVILMLMSTSIIFAETKFEDLNKEHWAYKSINSLVERGILKMSIPDKPKSTKQLFYCE